jgi:hypothetical protein
MRGPSILASQGHVQGLLGIFQRLIGSKINDVFAFELVQSLYEFVPLYVCSVARKRGVADASQVCHAAIHLRHLHPPSYSASEQAVNAIHAWFCLLRRFPLCSRIGRS